MTSSLGGNRTQSTSVTKKIQTPRQWYKGLNAQKQRYVKIGGGGAIATAAAVPAITIPIVLALRNKDNTLQIISPPPPEVIIDPSITGPSVIGIPGGGASVTENIGGPSIIGNGTSGGTIDMRSLTPDQISQLPPDQLVGIQMPIDPVTGMANTDPNSWSFMEASPELLEATKDVALPLGPDGLPIDPAIIPPTTGPGPDILTPEPERLVPEGLSTEKIVVLSVIGAGVLAAILLAALGGFKGGQKSGAKKERETGTVSEIQEVNTKLSRIEGRLGLGTEITYGRSQTSKPEQEPGPPAYQQQ